MLTTNYKNVIENKWKIRKVSINDIDKLKEIGNRTFIETYASVNSEENMAEYLENPFSTQDLKT